MNAAVVDVSPHHSVDWVLRALPAAACSAIGRPDLAARFLGQQPVTARMLIPSPRVRRYQPTVRAAVFEIEDRLEVADEDRVVPGWEIDALMYAEIGSAPCDLVHRVESTLIQHGGTHVAWWVWRLVRAAYLTDPSAVTVYVQRAYQQFCDDAVLNGFGRLEVQA